MPIYHYKCKKCAHIEEIEQSITEEPIKNCSKCPGEVFRMIGKGVGIQFMGQGFYVNDKSSNTSSQNS